jgi:hypothetical protein
VQLEQNGKKERPKQERSGKDVWLGCSTKKFGFEVQAKYAFAWKCNPSQKNHKPVDLTGI